MSLAQGINGAISGSINIKQSILDSNTLFTNKAALDYGIASLREPGKVTMIGLYSDSIWAGTQASDINTSTIQRFRTKYLDIVNANIGGSAKSGRGRFAPYHHNASGAVNGTAGPIIIGGSSGWTRATNYWTAMFWEDLGHSGNVTPGAGTSYAGCYMAMSQVGLTGNAAKWLGLLFNSSLTGTFRVQFRQGSSVVQTGTTGTNRFTIVGGVPDPTVGGADIKLDVTIDPTTASYPDFSSFITGHLNSTAMDPTAVWQVCIYRLNNAATSVSIQGFDAHYDEYTAQNTPNPLGAVVVGDWTRPGKTHQIFQSGEAQFGTNADYDSQGVPDIHISVHARSYNKYSNFTHTMPTLKLAITNFWRNDVLAVEAIPTMTPTIWATRLEKSALTFAAAGVPLVQVVDFGASAAYYCAFPYFDQSGIDYTNNSIALANKLAGLQSTKGIGGGLAIARKDLAVGKGGPQGYARKGFFSSIDYLHLNDAGHEWESDYLVALATNPSSITPYSTVASELVAEPLSITSRLGISKSTVFELDPNKYSTVRMSIGVGYTAIKRRHTDFGSFLHGIGVIPTDGAFVGPWSLGQSKSGSATSIIYNMDQFGQRAGLEFDNESAAASRIQYDLTQRWADGFPSGLTKFTIFYIVQNLRQANLSVPGQHMYWMFGSTADKAANPNSVYSTLSNQRVMLVAAQGLGSRQNYRVGDQVHTVGDYESYHNPVLGCITVDTTTNIVKSVSNPNELNLTGWNQYTAGAGTIASPWKPDWFSVGGPLGTSNICAAMAFGGIWVIDGVVTDAEYNAIWNQIYGESGGFFQTGTSFANSQQGGGIIA